jgi:hypothetical protein
MKTISKKNSKKSQTWMQKHGETLKNVGKGVAFLATVALAGFGIRKAYRAL